MLIFNARSRFNKIASLKCSNTVLNARISETSSAGGGAKWDWDKMYETIQRSVTYLHSHYSIRFTCRLMCMSFGGSKWESGKTVALYHFASFVMLNDVFALVEERRDRADENRLAIFHSFVKIVLLLWLRSCQWRKNTLCESALCHGNIVNNVKKNLGLLFKWKTLHSRIFPVQLSASAMVKWTSRGRRVDVHCGCYSAEALLSFLLFILFFFGEWDSEGEKRATASACSGPLACCVSFRMSFQPLALCHRTPHIEFGEWTAGRFCITSPLFSTRWYYSHSNSPQYLIVYFMGQWDFHLLGLFAPLSLHSLWEAWKLSTDGKTNGESRVQARHQS